MYQIGTKAKDTLWHEKRHYLCLVIYFTIIKFKTMKQLLFFALLMMSIEGKAQRVKDLPKQELDVKSQISEAGKHLQKSGENRNTALLCGLVSSLAALSPRFDENVPAFVPKYVSPFFGALALGFTISANINQTKAGKLLILK